MNFVFYLFSHILFFFPQIFEEDREKIKHMKKILVCMVLAMTVFTVSSFAQGGGGGAERRKQMLKDSIGLTDVQVDSVMAVTQEFGAQRRDIMMDQSMSADDKKAKMTDINLKIKARLKGTLTDDQIAKWEALQQRQMERMRNRQGGGGGGNK